MNASSIASVLGGRKSGNGWLVRCPCHDDRSPSLSLRDGDCGLLVKCFAGCSADDILRALARRRLLDDRRHRRDVLPPARQSPPPDNGQGNADFALRIWREAVPLKGTLGQVYLDRRRLVLPADCTDIRFNPRCPLTDTRQPAVVWLMRDIHTNQPRAIQRRFLHPDGTKDGKAWSLGPCDGAVLKLSPDDTVTLGLALAEGHADALAALGDGWHPCWATCGTGTMAKFPVLTGVEALTIFCDPNGPGRVAAQACAARWRATGKEVVILPPLPGYEDFAGMVERRPA